jgi:hypothetical protein
MYKIFQQKKFFPDSDDHNADARCESLDYCSYAEEIARIRCAVPSLMQDDDVDVPLMNSRRNGRFSLRKELVHVFISYRFVPGSAHPAFGIFHRLTCMAFTVSSLKGRKATS